MSGLHSSTFCNIEKKSKEMREDRVLLALASFRDEIIEEIDQLKQLLLHSFFQKQYNQFPPETVQDQVVSLFNETFLKNSHLSSSSFPPSMRQHDAKTDKSVVVDVNDAAKGNLNSYGTDVLAGETARTEPQIMLKDFNNEDKPSSPQLVKFEVAENLSGMNSQSEMINASSSQDLNQERTESTSYFPPPETDFLFSKEKTRAYNLSLNGIKQTFTCTQCGKVFPYKSSVVKHARTHTGVRPFVCKLCGKSFSQKGSLKYHIKIHTGDKPFKCKLCGKTFIHRGNLNYHEKTHHKHLNPTTS